MRCPSCLIALVRFFFLGGFLGWLLDFLFSFRFGLRRGRLRRGRLGRGRRGSRLGLLNRGGRFRRRNGRGGLGGRGSHRDWPRGRRYRGRRRYHASILHLEPVLRDHRDRIDRADNRALLAADAVLLDDDGLPRRVRIFRQREFAVHHADRFERAVVEAVRTAHADFLIDDRDRAAAADVLLGPDLESLFVPVLGELQVHLSDRAIVRRQGIRRRLNGRRGRGFRGRRRRGRHPSPSPAGEGGFLPLLVDVASRRPLTGEPLREELRDVHHLESVPLLARLPLVLVVEAAEVGEALRAC